MLYVAQSIINDGRSELLTSVFARYLELCQISGETPFSSAFCLKRHLTSNFGDKIKFQSHEAKKLGEIIFSAAVTDEKVRVAYDYAADDERTILKAASILREKFSKQDQTSQNDTRN